jgi:ubiquinone/menaquinone biosynthesis C-methylase UbiE
MSREELDKSSQYSSPENSTHPPQKRDGISHWDNRAISSKYLDTIEPQSDSDVNRTKKLYHDPFFYSILPDLDGITALDLGSGNFYMSSELQALHPTSTFIASDLPGMIEESLRRRNHATRLLPELSVLAARADYLPIKSNSLDLVTSSLMMHWVSDAEKIIREIHRTLKPGGTSIISLANPNFFKAGKFEDMVTPDPHFVPTIDTTKIQQLDVYLGKTIGPVTYYLRPVEEYRRIYEACCFTRIELYEPTFTDPELIAKNDFMKKYKKHPLYLMIEAIK